MRNATTTLSAVDTTRAAMVRDYLLTHAEDTLAVSYVKRDGSVGRAVGTFAGLAGQAGLSTDSFKVDTDTYPRTVNTYNVRSITRAGAHVAF